MGNIKRLIRSQIETGRFILNQRQIKLPQKLARATQLLRAKVDVDIVKQDRDTLERMSVRSQLQLRLQQTVEGLSIAAVCYYVVSLLGYTFKGVFYDLHFSNDELAMSILSPIAIMAVALFMRDRRQHTHSAWKHPAGT